jgi:threonine dehydratase
MVWFLTLLHVLWFCSGQGTIVLELLQQAPQLDAIIVPISGKEFIESSHVHESMAISA